MFKKVIYIIIILFILLFCLYLYRTMTIPSQVISEIDNTPVKEEQTPAFEAVELKTQNDFKLIGKPVFVGTGFEPGFNVVVSLAGNKFGTELVSQYGQTRYVGYLDLVKNATNTKIIAGQMLDKDNKIVGGQFTFTTKECILPSGESVPYTLDAQVGPEILNGCANIVN